MAGIAALNAPWRDRIEGFGRQIQVATPAGPHLGRFVDLDLHLGLTLAVGPEGGDDTGPLLRRIPLADILAVATTGPVS